MYLRLMVSGLCFLMTAVELSGGTGTQNLPYGGGVSESDDQPPFPSMSTPRSDTGYYNKSRYHDVRTYTTPEVDIDPPQYLIEERRDVVRIYSETDHGYIGESPAADVDPGIIGEIPD